MTFKERLASMGDAWKTGKDKVPGVPDGIYTMKLQKAEVNESAQGKLRIERHHCCIEGEHTGVVTRDYLNLETENGPYYAAKWIELMGYQCPENIEGIIDVVKAIEVDAAVYTAEVRVKDDFRNVRVKALLTESASGTAVIPPSPPAPKPAPVAPTSTPAPVPAPKPITKKSPATSDVLPAGTPVTFTDGQTTYTAKVERMADKEGAPNEYIVRTTENELYQLTRADLSAAGAPAAPAPAKEDTSEFLAFASAHSLEGVNDQMTVAQLTELINSYEYKRDELTPEEATFLEGLGATISTPPPKKASPPPPKKMVPAPAPQAPAAPTVLRKTPTK